MIPCSFVLSLVHGLVGSALVVAPDVCEWPGGRLWVSIGAALLFLYFGEYAKKDPTYT
jgi:hypothetical protein